ncbi:MAG: tetratricopeptide repeat protein, partial [Candidatus Acidiferrales bacterium]
YEMVTGRRPFPQSQGAELIGAILQQAPQPTRSTFEAVVTKALEKTPVRRYQTAGELLAALEATSRLTEKTKRTRHAASREWLERLVFSLALIGVIVGVIFGLNIGGVRGHLHTATPAGGRSFSSGPIKTRRAVAVLGFKNLSGRPDELWLSTALAEMLTTELAAGEQLRLIPGENIAQMKINFSLPEQDTYSKATLSRIRKNVGTDDVVVGSYLALGNGQLRVDLRLQDAGSGETVASMADSGNEAEVPDLVARVGEKLREKLGAGSLTTADAKTLTASLPSNPQAARLYSEGLSKLRVFNALGARDFLEKAVAMDPNYAAAHSALAEAWSTLGYDAKAKGEAKRAFELSENLSREDRLMIEGRYREIFSEWDKAAEIYRTLWNFFPDNLDYGLRLAEVETSASRGKEALDTIDQLRRLPGPSSEDPRIDIAEAEAANSIGDFKHDAAAAAKATEKGRALGATLLVARSQHLRCWALHKLGQRQESKSCCEESQRIFAEAGDRDGVASVLVTTATALHEQGDLALAQSRYEEALMIHRNTGDLGGVAVTLNNLGNVYVARGNFAVAKKMYEESVSISRDIGDKDGLVLALGNLASALTDEGDDLPRARTMYEELLVICREMGSKDRTALQLSNIGAILYWQGDLPGAEKALDEAVMLDSQTGERRQLGYDLAFLADVLQVKGNLPEVRNTLEKALRLRNELGDKGDAADTRIALADLSIEEGHPKEAEALLR